jgi:phosphoribosyl 1,2-cyclic phosphodiesterase
MTDLIVHGARGSMPVAGAAFARYGGHTACLAAGVEERRYLVIDAGTGLRNLEAALPGGGGMEFTFLLTHYHWDHIAGLGGFAPLRDPSNRFVFRGGSREGRDAGDLLGAVFRPPWHPGRLRDAAAGTVFADLPPVLEVGPVRIRSFDLRHPQGATGLRLDGPHRSVVVALDHEAGDAGSDGVLAEVAHHTDVLIHDSERGREPAGEGHSGWSDAAAAANACGAGRLVLAGHGSRSTDEEIDGLVREARARFPLTTGAFEGLRLPL